MARCPDFSRFDAAAILQEAVAKEAIANLVFGPIALDTTTVAGLCSYITSAHSNTQQIDIVGAPHLATAVAADQAVVATMIDAADIEQIRQLATLIWLI